MFSSFYQQDPPVCPTVLALYLADLCVINVDKTETVVGEVLRRLDGVVELRMHTLSENLRFSFTSDSFSDDHVSYQAYFECFISGRPTIKIGTAVKIGKKIAIHLGSLPSVPGAVVLKTS